MLGLRMGYKRIDLNERVEIFKGIYQLRLTAMEISRRLGRSPSSISREILKGTVSPGSGYDPFFAQIIHLKQMKNHCPKLKINDKLWKEIKAKLEIRWSPQQISDFLKSSKVESVSAKTIYNYIHFHMKGELKKLAVTSLRQRGKKKKSSKVSDGRGKLKEIRLIDERPSAVDLREVPGHWEGDLIIGKDHKSALLVIVERKTRFVQIDLLDKYDAKTVRRKIEKRFKLLKPRLMKTLTLDQGKENAEHQKLEENLKIEVYFCHPGSPWEKATCENTNGLIRDFLDGEKDFRKFNQRYFSRIARLLNQRPRETLGFSTPLKEFENLR